MGDSRDSKYWNMGGRIMNDFIVHVRQARFDILISRPSQWGNPFVIGEDGTREDVIRKHKEWLDTGENFRNEKATKERRQWVLRHVGELQGKVLGCWCNQDQACHGDYLIELANKEPR
jgi:hypothetical protein